MPQSIGVRHYWGTSQRFQQARKHCHRGCTSWYHNFTCFLAIRMVQYFQRQELKKRHHYPYCVVQSFSHIWLFATAWTAACQASLSFPISWSLLKLMSIESVTPPNYLILCRPLLLLPLIFPSIRVFSSESVLPIRWPKYWSFSFSISPSSEYPGLIFFRIDWFYLRAVQGILKCLLQHHNLKASILRHSAFQLS